MVTRIIWPEYIDLPHWSASLVADYPQEFLPILDNDNDWQEWGAIIVSTGVFARLGIPAPFSLEEGAKKQEFADWREWAKIVYNLMSNGKTKKVKI